MELKANSPNIKQATLDCSRSLVLFTLPKHVHRLWTARVLEVEADATRHRGSPTNATVSHYSTSLCHKWLISRPIGCQLWFEFSLRLSLPRGGTLIITLFRWIQNTPLYVPLSWLWPSRTLVHHSNLCADRSWSCPAKTWPPQRSVITQMSKRSHSNNSVMWLSREFLLLLTSQIEIVSCSTSCLAPVFRAAT